MNISHLSPQKAKNVQFFFFPYNKLKYLNKLSCMERSDTVTNLI